MFRVILLFVFLFGVVGCQTEKVVPTVKVAEVVDRRIRTLILMSNELQPVGQFIVRGKVIELPDSIEFTTIEGRTIKVHGFSKYILGDFIIPEEKMELKSF